MILNHIKTVVSIFFFFVVKASCQDLTVEYKGGKEQLDKNVQDALGTFKCIGTVVYGSPVYRRKNGPQTFYVFRDFGQSAYRKTWKGVVIMHYLKNTNMIIIILHF